MPGARRVSRPKLSARLTRRRHLHRRHLHHCSYKDLGHIDFVMYRDLQLRSGHVPAIYPASCSDDPSGCVSDHLPVFAEFDLLPPGVTSG